MWPKKKHQRNVPPRFLLSSLQHRVCCDRTELVLVWQTCSCGCVHSPQMFFPLLWPGSHGDPTSSIFAWFHVVVATENLSDRDRFPMRTITLPSDGYWFFSLPPFPFFELDIYLSIPLLLLLLYLPAALFWRPSDLQPSLDRVRSASTTCLRPEPNFHFLDRDR